MEELKNFANAYPLTHAQKRIWDTERKYKQRIANNIGGNLKIMGEVNFKVLQQAINNFIYANDGIRLNFLERENEVLQYVTKYKEEKIDFYDFSYYESPEYEFNKWVEEETEKPLLIADRKLYYFALFKISENCGGYYIKINHILADGWSISLMTHQIEQNYTAIINNEKVEDDIKPSYINYIEKEVNYKTSQKFEKNKAFWNNLYNDVPRDMVYIDSCKARGNRKVFQVNQDKSNKIRKLISDNKLTMNTFMVGLYLLYINKLTGKKDITIGTPVLNRSGKVEKETFGMFVSTMPFRFSVDEDSTILENVSRVNESLMNCYFNQRYPYDLLIEDLGLKKRGFDSLFNVFINYYNTKLNECFNGFPAEKNQLYCGFQEEPLQIIINEWSTTGEITVYFDYRINQYTERQINYIYLQLYDLAKKVVANPYEQVANLTLSNRKKSIVYDIYAARYSLMSKKSLKSLPDKLAVGH